MILIPLIFNFWIWRIFSINFFIALITLATALSLYQTFKSRSFPLIFFSLFSILLFFQYQTTSPISLTQLTNDQIRIRDMRLRAYPPQYLQIGYYFEQRKEATAFFRLQKNFSEVIDPNLYFFANHPRERIGVKEFEKFPYFFLPFFIIGLWQLSPSSFPKIIFISAVPIALITTIGNQNPLGPFSLFPLLAVTITHGLSTAYQKVLRLAPKHQKYLLISSLTIFILIFIESLSYAIN